MHAQRIAIICLAGVGVVGTFLPWGTVGFTSVTGTAGAGWITLTLFVATGSIAGLTGARTGAPSSGARWGMRAVAFGAAMLGLYELSRIRGAGDTVGPGLYAIAGTALLVVAVSSFGGRWWEPGLTALVLGVVAAAGFIHITYGPAMGVNLCRKDSWSLTHTLIDGKEFDGRPFFSLNREDAMAVVDLMQCGILQDVDLGPSNAPTCWIGDQSGVCMNVDRCNGVSMAGQCVGPDPTRCCVPMLKAQP